jgi:hypothetical protein
MAEVYRLRLLRQRTYIHDLDRLLALIELADLPEPNDSILESYRRGRRVRDSDVYALAVDQLSTIASKQNYDMSNFDISSLHGEYKASVNIVTFNNDRLRAFVAERVFHSSVDELQLALNELTLVLTKLRSHFIYLREEDFQYTEPGYFQPLFTMFLERLACRMGRSTCSKPGSAFPLAMEVDVALDNGTIETVSVVGKTDIVKVPTVDADSFDSVEFLLELKAPFASLYQATSDGPKGQLVSQLLGLWEMSGVHRVVSMGGLSDLFALMVCFAHVDRKREFHMTKAVVDAEDYVLHLMLLFCSDQDVRHLVNAEGGVASSVVPHEDASDETSRNWKRAYTDEDYEACWKGERDLQEWYARHYGLLPLNEGNIDRHGSYG